MALDSQRKELILGLNSFDTPAEAIGKEAWIRLILNLLYLKKGTYPSNPEIGIDIQSYDFGFMDDAIDKLQSEIMSQVRTFLPDIPLESVIVKSDDIAGKKVLILILNFMDDGSVDTSVVASTITNNIINFEVSI